MENENKVKLDDIKINKKEFVASVFNILGILEENKINPSPKNVIFILTAMIMIMQENNLTKAQILENFENVYNFIQDNFKVKE